MTKPTVCFVFPFALVGGIETLFATILKYLPRDTFNVMAVAPTGIEYWLDVAVKPIVDVYSYPDIDALAEFIDREKPAICVTAFSYSIARAMEKTDHKPKLVETCHNLYHSVGESLRAVEPWISCIVSVSQSVEENVARSLPDSLKDTQRYVIPTGIDTSIYRPRGELRHDVKSYAYFGRLSDPEKGLLKLMEGFHSLGDRNRVLNLYGKGNSQDEDQRFRTIAKTKYRYTNICFKGFVSAPHDHLHHNDVVVIRSPMEGFCNAALEAMACGVPLVAYNFRGILDHLPKDKRCCLIANNQPAFVQAMFDAQNLRLRQELRKNALEYVQKFGDAKIMAAKYHDIFLSLMENKSALVDGPLSFVEDSSEPSEKFTVAAVCSQYSTSIVHAMQEVGAKPVTVPYGVTLKTAQLKEFIDYLSNFETVIFNAACEGYVPLLMALHSRGVKCLALYHSSFCGYSFENLFDATERQNLQYMLDWNKAGIVKAVGFVNESSASFYKGLGYNAAYVPNVPMQVQDKYSCPGVWEDNHIHVGVFSRNNSMKNTVLAVSCALAHPNVVVHTADPIHWAAPGITRDNERIVTHGWLSKAALLSAMSSMHMTLMMSFTESYGLLVTQSWAVGTPCITGPACLPLFTINESDYNLKEYLCLDRIDSMGNLPELIEDVARNYANLSERCKQRIDILREYGQQKFKEFIS